jgi:hypothetical protein
MLELGHDHDVPNSEALPWSVGARERIFVLVNRSLWGPLLLLSSSDQIRSLTINILIPWPSSNGHRIDGSMG